MALSIDLVNANDLEELVSFADPFQEEAQRLYPALPSPEDGKLCSVLQQRIANGNGVVARNHGDIVGMLLGIGPFDNFRPAHRGVYSPLCSCLVSDAGRDLVFTQLLTEYGNIPEFAGVQIASLTVFPNSSELNDSLVQNGFGVRCVDSIALIDDLPTAMSALDVSIEKVAIEDAVELQAVKQVLALHLASSPIFQDLFDFSSEFINSISEQRQSVHFAARDGDRIVGFIEATSSGENYFTMHPQMRNICGAGVLPEYRNRGIMHALLVALANHYRSEGITTLGVDYESQNPQARAFWEKYFTPYTWGWERHFDRAWGAL